MVPKKSKEEKASDSYFKTNADAKKTTEKEVAITRSREEILKNTTVKKIEENKPVEQILKNTIVKKSSRPLTNELITIEKIGAAKKAKARKKTVKKKIARKKTAKKTTTKSQVYKIPKILLKSSGYELIITEKPQAALKIASSLGTATKREIVRGVPYYEVDRKGEKIIVACAVGHLFTLKQMIPGSSVPIFDINWAPNYMVRKKDFSKRYYDTLLKLAKNAGKLTVATDFDIEGEVIGTNIVRLICNQEDAQRMSWRS